jgi:UDPglucose 6-dehydrogenase
MKHKIGIIGSGWVGGAMKELFPDAYVYTRTTGDKKLINKCDVVFIAVPTPLIEKGKEKGRLDTSIVQDVISWCEAKLIVIRSTVNPGDTYRWKMMFKKHIVFQPEYLGETPNHPLLNTQNTPFIIIGGSQPDRKKLIELYTTVYNANLKIRQTDDYTAEVIKLTENRAIAFKVMQCQELYDACQKANVDYYTVRDAVFGDDPRMNLWFTMIYPGNRGFNSSKCLKKDVPAWVTWAKFNKYKADITALLVEKSNQYAKKSA